MQMSDYALMRSGRRMQNGDLTKLRDELLLGGLRRKTFAYRQQRGNIAMLRYVPGEDGGSLTTYRVRLTVRTTDFESENRGSIP